MSHLLSSVQINILPVSIELFPKWHFRKSPNSVCSRRSTIQVRLLSNHFAKLPSLEKLTCTEQHASRKHTASKRSDRIHSIALSWPRQCPCALCDAVSHRRTLSAALSAETWNQLGLTRGGDARFHQRCDETHLQSVEVYSYEWTICSSRAFSSLFLVVVTALSDSDEHYCNKCDADENSS